MTNNSNVEQTQDDCSGFVSDATKDKITADPKGELDEDIAGRKASSHSTPGQDVPVAINSSNGDDCHSSHPPASSHPIHLPWQSPNPTHFYQQPPPYWQNNISNPNNLNVPNLGQQPSHLLQFFESQMRDHAAAFANAAAGAAFVSAQIAADMASASTTTMHYPAAPQSLPKPPYMFQNAPMMQPCLGPQNIPMQFVGCQTPVTVENNNVCQHFEDDAFENSSSSECMHRRRKRQHRGPPSAIQHGRGESASLSHLSPVAGPTGRRRRRSRNNLSSHSESKSSGFNSTKSRRRNRRTALTSSGSDGGNAYNITKKKQRQPEPDNISLIGKTGVAALYVFCEKRGTTPLFRLRDRSDGRKDANVGIEDFEIVVSVDGHDCGHGRGKNKAGAKQEAARLALQALLPGVEFDKASGILMNLPESSIPRKSVQNPWSQREAATTAEDLAPNLAKFLAIGRENEKDEMSSQNTTPDNEKTLMFQRRKHVYPETSTTSEEEDEDTYYASRGASVCSALLHAMVQIDDRIPEPPVYTYHVSAVGPPPRNKLHLKRKAGGPQCTPGVIHRGSRGIFNCTGTMGVEVSKPDPGKPSFDILQAIGVGGTKREARHRASAKLLAMLFPECEGMVAVKQAAEAFREKYAADKALKQQSKRNIQSVDDTCVESPTLAYRGLNTDPPEDCQFGIATNGPILSLSAENHILFALEHTRRKDGLNMTSSDGPLKSRQLSRQAQLDGAVSLALQKLNEHDEDGRSLPDELTVDDVGRTVLRRSTPADVHWIMKLIEGEGQLRSSLHPPRRKANNPKHSKKDIGEEFNATLLRHWLSSSIVLLLCRAIAPFEDPPLGCAALAMGFSMEKGCTLRVTQIASKSHLPLERFIEVLQSFSREMSCTLELSGNHQISDPVKVNCDDIEDILKSHLVISAHPIDAARKQNNNFHVLEDHGESLLPSRLQSVQEEFEDLGNCSGVELASEKRNPKPGQVKPSKRTRVQ